MSIGWAPDCDLSAFSDPLSEDIVLEVNPDDYLCAAHRDIFKQISEDLGIPNLPEEVLNKDVLSSGNSVRFARFPDDISEFLVTKKLKHEPPSPGYSSTDSSASCVDDWTSLVNNGGAFKNTNWKIPETPPTTPPENGSLSPPVSPPLSCASTCNPDEAPHFPISNVNSGVSPSQVVLTAGNGVLQLSDTVGSTATTGVCKGNRLPGSSLVLTRQRIAPKSILPIGSASTPSTAAPVSSCKSPMEISGILPFSKHIEQEVNLTAMKRQQRKIKNRESACLSRKKKKEYLQGIEDELRELNQENGRLKFENEQLRRRVLQLEKEKALCPHNHASTVKKATALLAVVFLISLNLGPLCGIFLNNNERIRTLESSIKPRHGRSLLWNDENEESTLVNNSAPEKLNRTGSPAPNRVHSQNSVCPTYINKSESMRLERDLRGWVFRSEERATMDSISRREFKKNLPPMPRLRHYFEAEARKHGDYYGITPDSRELQLYQSIPQSYNDLLKAIKHREDTFYVVSFTGDHLLWPARVHNKTTRPLMSLVLPALTLKDGKQPPKDHIAMMLIDSQVMNTTVVYVKESLIRHSVRKHDDNVFQSAMASSAPDLPKPKGASSRRARKSFRKAQYGNSTNP